MHLESVILYNDVIFKCNVQSFVTDFVSVIGWVDSEGGSHPAASSHGNWTPKIRIDCKDSQVDTMKMLYLFCHLLLIDVNYLFSIFCSGYQQIQDCCSRGAGRPWQHRLDEMQHPLFCHRICVCGWLGRQRGPKSV